MISTKNFLKIVVATSGCVFSATALHADVITQIANSNANVGWNSPTLWGDAPTAGNDYVSAATGGSTRIYSINGIDWFQQSWSVQDTSVATSTVSSTFSGDRLFLTANTTLNAKAGGGSTQTANLVFDGGFYRGNAANSGAQSSTLAGTINFGNDATIAAMGTGATASSTGNYTFTLNSTIVGGADNTLQLTMNGGTAKTVLFNVNGDLSGYAGTLYLGVSLGGIQPGTGVNSAFSISSNAPLATLQLDTITPNFHYNLGSGNVTFGSLLYGDGSGIVIDPGTYDAAQLNALTSSEAFFGSGSITVVPEPGTTVLCALGVVTMIWTLRRRRTAN